MLRVIFKDTNGVLLFFLTSLVCFTWLGMLGDKFWFADLSDHFRLQYAIILLSLLFLFLQRRKMLFAFLSFGHAVLNFYLVYSFVWVDREVPSARVVSSAIVYNVRESTTNFQGVLDLASQYQPDILGLIEIDEHWHKALGKLSQDYPNIYARPQPNNYGLSLYSKFRIVKSETIYLTAIARPSLRVKLEGREQNFVVYLLHPLPPSSPQYYLFRNQQLDELAKMLKKEELPVLVLGDVNITPWSRVFKNFVSQAEISADLKGRGIWNTWPAYFPFMGIPIDHIFSIGLNVFDVERLEPQGSDHYPLLAKFSLASRESNK